MKIASETPLFDPAAIADLDALTPLAPRVLWIELTSTCPFDCVFCSRRLLRGRGQHMDFAMFQRLIADLDRPEIVRLNYSGESIHYPHLLEAIELAHATGARTELVTAFASIPARTLEGLAASRLDKVTISLHTLDAAQYRDIYRFASLDDLRTRVARFLELRGKHGRPQPELEFGFVAMSSNLDQLAPLARYARECGVQRVEICPLVRRDPIAETFAADLENGRLRTSVRARLQQTVAEVQANHPELEVHFTDPDWESHDTLSHLPRYYSPRLPEHARLLTCDQDPFATVHVLANGDVVTCEVRDRVPMGNLGERSLRDIWRGATYGKFRRDFYAGCDGACRDCTRKMAFVPQPMRTAIAAADGDTPQLLRGWFPRGDGEGVRWSGAEAVLVVPASARVLALRGLLPHDPRGRHNVLEVRCDGVAVGRVANTGSVLQSFEQSWSLPAPANTGLRTLAFRVSVPFCPAALGVGPDIRTLGFALERLAVLPT